MPRRLSEAFLNPQNQRIILFYEFDTFLFLGMQKEYVVYVLFSKKYNRTYAGFTSNLIARFKDHNELGKKGYCKRFRPWFIIYVRYFLTKTEARDFEKRLKTGKGREWIRNEILPIYESDGSYQP